MDSSLLTTSKDLIGQPMRRSASMSRLEKSTRKKQKLNQTEAREDYGNDSDSVSSFSLDSLSD